MTNIEYTMAYRQFRQTLAEISKSERATLLKVYSEAAREAGEVLKAAQLRGASQLTIDRWSEIKNELASASHSIAVATNSAVVSSIRKATAIADETETEYITSAATAAGLTIKGLESVYVGINTQLIDHVLTSVYNGVSYSTRVWGGSGVAGDWLEKVRLITSAGIAQGRDPAAIARDLMQYTREGPTIIARWGNLLPGTREYIARLGSAPIDYRAMRLVRTELHNGLRNAAIDNAQANPAWDGSFDWVMARGRVNWPCDCPQLEAGSPYTVDTIPRKPHVLCMCSVIARMVGRNEFIQYLKDYKSGVSSVGANKISAWAAKYNLEVE